MGITDKMLVGFLSYNRTFKRDMPGRETHFKLAQILLFYMDVTLNV